MYTFENTDTLEMDLYFEQAKYILSGMPSSDSIEYYTESENIISRAIEAIGKALKAFFKKIGEILTGKKRKETANALEEAIKQNPKLGKEKVEVHDYTEMRKLQKDTLNELKKPNCDTQKTMEEYKKKRKGLLTKMGIGAGITAAVAGTAITAAVLCKKLINPESIKQFASKLGASFHKDTTDVMGKNVGDGDQSSAAQGATTVLNDGLGDATNEIRSQEAAGRKVLKRYKVIGVTNSKTASDIKNMKARETELGNDELTRYYTMLDTISRSKKLPKGLVKEFSDLVNRAKLGTLDPSEYGRLTVLSKRISSMNVKKNSTK